MKKILAVSLLSMISLGIHAELNGYYRIKNFETERYMYVTDNKGSINWHTTDADVSALKLFKGFEKASSNPETIIYIDNRNGSLTLEAQGTRLSALIDGADFHLHENSDGTYYAYASKSGATKYLSDAAYGDVEEGRMTTNGKGNERKWYILPINSENYFGILPTVNIGEKNFASFYADFPFSVPEGMKVYYVSQTYGANACMKEITGVIPAGLPVFIECVSATPADNIINIGGSPGTIPADNQLGGVYFDNTGYGHFNATTFDANTMRVLGVTSEGKLGYVTPSELQYLPANQSYLKVAPGTPSELTLLNEEEFTAGIEDIVSDNPNRLVDVYNINGILVKKNIRQSDVKDLPKGVYIIGNKKIMVR